MKKTPQTLDNQTNVVFFRVPYTEVFSNQLLDDLDKLWELRYWIPDPTDPKKCVVEVGR